jgi:hypothetical protein
LGPWVGAIDGLLLSNESKSARERLTLIQVFEGSCLRDGHECFNAIEPHCPDFPHANSKIFRLI